MVYTSGSRENGDKIPTNLNFSETPMFGREKEVDQLRDAFRRIHCHDDREATRKQTELVLIGGQSGTGKSSLVQTLRNEESLANGVGCFISGKFSEMPDPKPYSALVDALDELCDFIYKHNDHDVIRKGLRESLSDEDALILANVIPNCGRVFGGERSGDTPITVRKEFGFERLKIALRLFLSSACSRARPVVLFLDDIQWADAASIQIVESLLFDEPIEGLMIILAYRDNDIDENHQLDDTLSRIRANDTDLNVADIRLTNLDVDNLNQLVATVTELDTTTTRPLSEVIYRKTEGNPFFSIQFLSMLQEKSLLYLSPTTFKCDWNIDRIQSETSLADNVVDLMASKIDRMPSANKDMLKVASCLGTHFDARLVSAILEIEASKEQASSVGNVSQALALLLKEGMIEETSNPNIFRFGHDRIREGAYALLSVGSERDSLHLRIGRYLQSRMDNQETSDDTTLLLTTDQMNMGSVLIEDDSEKLELARLNIEAARCCEKLSAFFPATAYLSKGLSLVPGKSKWIDHYDMVLEMCSLLTEMAYCCGDFELCRKTAVDVELHGKSALDKIRVQFTLVKAEASDGDIEKAIDIGLRVLQQLGVKCRRNPHKVNLLVSRVVMKRQLRKITEDYVMKLPPVTDETMLVSAEMIRLISVYAWQSGNLALNASLTLRALEFCVWHGTTTATPEMLVGCGVLQASQEDLPKACELGRISAKLIMRDGITAPSLRAVTMKFGFLDFTHPIHDSVNPLLMLYDMSFEIGDLQCAAIVSVLYTLHYLFSGLPLAPLNGDVEMFVLQLTRYRQHAQASICRIYRQFILNLMGSNDGALELTGEAMDQSKMLAHLEETHNRIAIFSLWIARLMLAYVFDDLDLAEQMANLIFSEHMQLVARNNQVLNCHFYGALTSMALQQRAGRRKLSKRARKAIELFEEMVGIGAVNYHHMLLFLYAERALLEGSDTDIIKQAYEKAIISASRSGFVQHAALANERAGLFFLERDDTEWSEFYLRQAYDLYREWGAMAKVIQLKEQHHFLAANKRQDGNALKQSRFVKGRARFNRDNAAKHKGELLRELLRSGTVSSDSLSAKKQLLDRLDDSGDLIDKSLRTSS